MGTVAGGGWCPQMLSSLQPVVVVEYLPNLVENSRPRYLSHVQKPVICDLFAFIYIKFPIKCI